MLGINIAKHCNCESRDHDQVTGLIVAPQLILQVLSNGVQFRVSMEVGSIGWIHGLDEDSTHSGNRTHLGEYYHNGFNGIVDTVPIFGYQGPHVLQSKLV